jgi:hypothetical protein
MPMRFARKHIIKAFHPQANKSYLTQKMGRPTATKEQTDKNMILPLLPLNKGTGKTAMQMTNYQPPSAKPRP